MFGFKRWLAILLLGGAVGACSPSTPAKTAAEAQAEARTITVALQTAWMTAAQTCIAVAKTEGQLQTCASVLDPARDALDAADVVINAWGPQSSTQSLICTFTGALTGIEAGIALEGTKVPAEVTSAEALVSALVQVSGKCSSGDAGVTTKDGAK
jgi:hypothetical protein